MHSTGELGCFSHYQLPNQDLGVQRSALRAPQRISQLAFGILENPKISTKKGLVFSGGPATTSGDFRDGRNGLSTENTTTL